MKCHECRWWFKLYAPHDKTDWSNCLAMPYPTCMETMTHKDAECCIPDKFTPKENERDR